MDHFSEMKEEWHRVPSIIDKSFESLPKGAQTFLSETGLTTLFKRHSDPVGEPRYPLSPR